MNPRVHSGRGLLVLIVLGALFGISIGLVVAFLDRPTAAPAEVRP